MHVLWNIGQTLHERGEHHEALQHLLQALRVVERLEMHADATMIMTEVARVHAALGNLDDAEHFAQTALSGARHIGDLAELAEAQWVLARVEASRGNISKATELLQEALSRFDALQMQGKVTEVARELGQLLRSEGTFDAAAADLRALKSSRPEEVASVIDFHDPLSK
jgi:tetratricopeptide (TPR) repeat protein